MPLPSERDPVLLVHANTVLPLSVPYERLQTITRNSRHVVQTLRRIKHRQLPMHGRPDVARHAPRDLAVSLCPQVRGRGVRERLDHGTTTYGYRVSVKYSPAIGPPARQPKSATSSRLARAAPRPRGATLRRRGARAITRTRQGHVLGLEALELPHVRGDADLSAWHVRRHEQHCAGRVTTYTLVHVPGDRKKLLRAGDRQGLPGIAHGQRNEFTDIPCAAGLLRRIDELEFLPIQKRRSLVERDEIGRGRNPTMPATSVALGRRSRPSARPTTATGADFRRRLEEPRRFIQVVAGPRQVGKTTLAMALNEPSAKGSKSRDVGGVLAERVGFVHLPPSRGTSQRASADKSRLRRSGGSHCVSAPTFACWGVRSLACQPELAHMSCERRLAERVGFVSTPARDSRMISRHQAQEKLQKRRGSWMGVHNSYAALLPCGPLPSDRQRGSLPPPPQHLQER